MDLDWTTIRRNVLPAIGAVVLAAGLWFGAGPLLSGGAPEPVPEAAERLQRWLRSSRNPSRKRPDRPCW